MKCLKQSVAASSQGVCSYNWQSAATSTYLYWNNNNNNIKKLYCQLNNFQNGQISYWSVGTSSLSNNQVSPVEIHLVTVCCVNSNVNTYFLHFEILILNTFYLLCQISSLFTYIHTTRYKIYYIKLNLLFEKMRRFVNNTHWVKIVQTSDHIHMNLCNVSNKFKYIIISNLIFHYLINMQ